MAADALDYSLDQLAPAEVIFVAGHFLPLPERVFLGKRPINPLSPAEHGELVLGKVLGQQGLVILQ